MFFWRGVMLCHMKNLGAASGRGEQAIRGAWCNIPPDLSGVSEWHGGGHTEDITVGVRQIVDVDTLAYVRRDAPEQFALLRRCGEIAGSRWRVYAVGGFVRDALRGCPNRDLDLLVEQEGERYAERLAAELGGELLRHPAFGTATLTLPDGQHLDVVQTRAESYAFPGALPTVRPGTLEDDLRRRDFTANSLAICLNADRFGALIDAGTGYVDWQQGILRIWHERSFSDDPTRIFRALKYAERCGWTLEPDTARRLREGLSVGVLTTVSPARLVRELTLMLQEPRAPRHLGNLLNWGVLQSWGWPLVSEPAMKEVWRRGEAVWHNADLQTVASELSVEDRVGFWLCLALHQVSAEQGKAWLKDQGFSGKFRKLWEQCARLRDLELGWERLDAVQRASFLAPYPVAALLWLYAITDSAETQAALVGYLLRWRDVKPLLNGGEVSRLLGISGSAIKEALRGLWLAQGRGQVNSRETAEAWLRRRNW